MPRGIGWAITGAAQSVFLHRKYLGGGFRCFLPPRTGGRPPFGLTRLASAGGGVEGSRWRLRFVGNGRPWGKAIEGSDRIGECGLTSDVAATCGGGCVDRLVDVYDEDLMSGGNGGGARRGGGRVSRHGLLLAFEYHQNVSQCGQEKCQRFKFFFR